MSNGIVRFNDLRQGHLIHRNLEDSNSEDDGIYNDLQIESVQLEKRYPSLSITDDELEFGRSDAQEVKDVSVSKAPEVVIAKVGAAVAKGVIKGAFKGVKFGLVKGIKFGLGVSDDEEYPSWVPEKNKKKEEKETPKPVNPDTVNKPEEDLRTLKEWEKHLEYNKTQGKRKNKVKKVKKLFKGLKRFKVRLFKKKGEYKKFSRM